MEKFLDKKYISKLTDRLAHCSHCRGVLLKDFKVEKEKNLFLVRCPHCRKDVLVILQDHNLQIEEKWE